MPTILRILYISSEMKQVFEVNLNMPFVLNIKLSFMPFLSIFNNLEILTDPNQHLKYRCTHLFQWTVFKMS